MTQMRLTHVSDVFSFDWNAEKCSLELRWDIALDLKCVPKIRLCSIQMSGLYVQDFILLPIYCNLIDSTTLNPLRELDRVLVDPLEQMLNHASTGWSIFVLVNQTTFRDTCLQY